MAKFRTVKNPTMAYAYCVEYNTSPSWWPWACWEHVASFRTLEEADSYVDKLLNPVENIVVRTYG